MRVFAVPYRIHFDDTMAYGSHHYLTNFKFQCEARERLYFSEDEHGQKPWLADRDALLLLTVEGYSRNLSPVKLADDVIVFMTLAEASRSSVLCVFRTVRSDGEPVACGYQRIVTASASSDDLVALPRSITRFAGRIDELVESKKLVEALQRGAGATKQLFSPELRELARRLAAQPELERHPQFLDVQAELARGEQVAPSTRDVPLPVRTASTLAATPSVAAAPSAGGVVLMFPGQGTLDLEALRGLFVGFPMVRDAFLAADRCAREQLGAPFLPLVANAAADKRQAALAACPDLDQLGIFLQNVLTADLLQREGLQPGALMGHSFGEIAAFTIAGALTIEQGLEVVCARVRALRHALPGKMMAVPCAPTRMRELIAQSALTGLEISVVNHREQTVVSGDQASLEKLEAVLLDQRMTGTLLKGRHPFHSSLLAPCVGPFAVALRGQSFVAPRIPVYSPIGQLWFRERCDLGRVLPLHFVEPLDFAEALRSLSTQGFSMFVECGAGTTLKKLVERNLDPAQVRTASCILAQEALPASKQRMLETLRAWGQLQGAPTPVVSAASQATAPAPARASTPETTRFASTAAQPIALIGAGTVLPGAAGEDAFWRALVEGSSGIVDFAETERGARADFLAAQGASDKTYSLLGGYVSELGPFADRTAFRKDELARMGKPEKMLAVALAELRSQVQLPVHGRTLCLLGATADGSIERDEEVFLKSVGEVLEGALSDRARGEQLRGQFEAAFRRGPAPNIDQHAALSEAVRRHFGDATRTLLIDAACASSLYALGVAMSLLELGVYDTVIAGGVYEPGPANACLFSQFRGLSATGSRPFDASADGVVFGEGACVVLLKRLPDALRDGDRVRAVIRAVGMSSDGRSPSVNVPRAAGQALAMRRAYAHSELDPASIQFVEAHATATRVGDATEFQGLLDVFGKRDPALPKIRLESVKNQIGHTGWTAGVASLIKIVKCFEARTFPAQHGYQSPSDKIPLAGSPFVIPTAVEPWPENHGGAPRRAAADGFGFGGTNAHVIVDEFRPRDWQHVVFARPESKRVAVVGMGALYPSPEGGPQGRVPTQPTSFVASALPLPGKTVILPDVRESMDATQLSALLACEQALQGLPWERLRDEIGVVVGLTGKTALSVSASERLFCDRLRRLAGEAGLDARLTETLIDGLSRRARASGPYTLPGCMPNVTAGRVANLLDLHGPNFVLDTGASSLADSLKVGPQLLAAGCKVVLVGGLNAFSGPLAERVRGPGARPIGEGALMLALALEPTVREYDLPVLAWLDSEEDDGGSAVEVGHAALDLRGAEGAIELQAALLNAQSRATVLRWPDTLRQLRVVPPRQLSRPSVPPPAEPIAAPSATISESTPRQGGFVTDTPILVTTPTLLARPLAPRSALPAPARTCLLVQQEELARARGGQQVLAPAAAGLSNVLAIDTASEASMAAALANIEPPSLLLIALRCAPSEPARMLDQGYAPLRALMRLTFAAFKRFYDAIADGRTQVGFLLLDALCGELPCPESGVLAGFAKAQVREMKAANIRIVGTAERELEQGLLRVHAELAQPALEGKPEEVWYVRGARHVVALRELPAAQRSALGLTRESVALVTGGARGITAILTAGLLEKSGCSVYLLGRSDPSQVPAHVLAMSEPEFAAWESSFYAESMKARPGTRMPALKREYEALRSAREVARTLDELRRAGGTVHYRSADVSKASALAPVLREIAERHGRLDLIVHGAGVQVSKRLPSKDLATFEWVVDTKLDGLSALWTEARRHLPRARPHVHMLTSAFSYIGNDGQPDYGAANEAMNRLALCCDGSAQRFSSLAWLGWDGIGMTAGSEFATLGRSRGLRGVRPAEGQRIFEDLLADGRGAAIQVTMAEGELEYFGLELSAEEAPRAKQTVPLSLSLTELPLLRDHVVRGRPAVPGTMQLELVAHAACKLYPELELAGFAHMEFVRFLNLGEQAPAELWVELSDQGESQGVRRLAAELHGRFLHASGRVLAPDVLHARMQVMLARELPRLGARELPRENARLIRDPYAVGGEVQHRGVFAHLGEIALGEHGKRALFRSPDPRAYAQRAWAAPMLLLDACLTLGMVSRDAQGRYPICAAHEVGEVRFGRGLDARAELGSISLAGTLPAPSGEDLRSPWVQARGALGEVLVEVRDMYGRPFDQIAGERVEVSAPVASAWAE